MHGFSRKTLAVVLGTSGLLLISGPTPARGEEHARRFQFQYQVTLKNLPAHAQRVRIWIPVAHSGPHQQVALTKVTAAIANRLTTDRQFGNRMLYAEIHHPGSRPLTWVLDYTVTRREYSRGTFGALLRYNRPDPRPPVSLERFLLPDRLVPTSGKIKELADAQTSGKDGTIEKAHALYDFVFHTLRYDKTGTGWGRGDALWACDAKHGNCTDFHSLFIALARAEGIPARFDIGFPLPAGTHQGRIPGYHCWAEFYVEGFGWVPVDISEAWQNPAQYNYFFGSLDVNRVHFSSGRDLKLAPPQDGPPLNYFVYPYVEVDGKPFDGVEKSFSFRDDTAPHPAGRPPALRAQAFHPAP